MSANSELANRIEELAAKATPGPWSTAYRERRHDGMFAQEVFDAKGETIATLTWYVVPTERGVTTNREENACLITELVNNLPTFLTALRSSGEGESDSRFLAERLQALASSCPEPRDEDQTTLLNSDAREFITRAAGALSSLKPSEGELPADVVRLVIAARIVAFERQDNEALRELDAASEAFASRVAWEDDPNEHEESNLTSDEIAMIDQAWENHKAALPIATVINNNQPGWTNTIETAPGVTLDVGTKLYAEPKAVALSSSKTVPEGWRLVPVEPTEEMYVALRKLFEVKGMSTKASEIYSTILSASPSPSGEE